MTVFAPTLANRLLVLRQALLVCEAALTRLDDATLTEIIKVSFQAVLGQLCLRASSLGAQVSALIMMLLLELRGLLRTLLIVVLLIMFYYVCILTRCTRFFTFFVVIVFHLVFEFC